MLGLHQSLLGCCRQLSRDHRGKAPAVSAVRATPQPRPAPRRLRRGRRLERDSVAARLLTIIVLVAALVSLLLEVPGLQTDASEVSHVGGSWLILGVALELAS